MKAYQDKESGKWKWGTRGLPIYETKAAAEKGGLDILTKRLREVRDKLNGALVNHGRV